MGKYFSSSGIRDVYDQEGFLSPNLGYRLGLASAQYTNNGVVVVGRDPRLSGPALRKSLLKGLIDCEVIDIGVVPTPVLSWTVSYLHADLGIEITASHNREKYNGFKLWNSRGLALNEQEERRIEDLIDMNPYGCPAGMTKVHLSEIDINDTYLEAVMQRIRLKGGMRIGLDCADGAACDISPRLLQRYGFDVVKVNCEFNGNFPGRDPEPRHDSLEGTARHFYENGCSLGFAHDGDADRIVLTDGRGRVADFDKLITFVCEQVYLEYNHGPRSVVTNVDASMLLEGYLSKYPQLNVLRTKVGDVFIANQMIVNNSIFGGEPIGAYIFPEFSLAPDGLYSMIKLLSYLEHSGAELSDILDSMQKPISYKTKILCNKHEKECVIPKLYDYVPSECSVDSTDGLMMTGPEYRVLIRPSGTESCVRLTVEAISQGLLEEKVTMWTDLIKQNM